MVGFGKGKSDKLFASGLFYMPWLIQQNCRRDYMEDVFYLIF